MTSSCDRAAAARRAVGAIFFVCGAGFGVWAAHIPLVQMRLGLSSGLLGTALLGLALGAMLSMPVAGWMIGRIGSRIATILAAIAFPVVLPLPMMAPGFWALLPATILLGAVNGVLDVSMNAQGVVVERELRYPTMSWFHAFFSIGGLVGSAGSGLLIPYGDGGVGDMAVVAVLLLAVAVPASRRLLHDLPQEDRRTGDRKTGAGPTFVLPRGALLGLGALAFLGMVGEGAMADWSGVYLATGLGVSPAVAATGYAAFSLTMAVGRLTGDVVVRRLGRRQVLRLSGLLSAGGLAAALLTGSPAVALLGFAIVGFGYANIVPILFSAGGHGAANPGAGVAAVATAGYAGFLVGPPLIGYMAEAIGLAGALGLIVAAGLVTAAAAGRVSS